MDGVILVGLGGISGRFVVCYRRAYTCEGQNFWKERWFRWSYLGDQSVVMDPNDRVKPRPQAASVEPINPPPYLVPTLAMYPVG